MYIYACRAQCYNSAPWGLFEITSKADTMRGFQCLLFCVLLYSASVEVFGQLECDEDGDCPDNATCEDVDGEDLCVCGADFDAVDVPGLTIGGTAVTVCIGMENKNLMLIYLHSMYISLLCLHWIFATFYFL